MAQTPAQRKALEAKALKAESKSAGMRLLFEAGFTVTEVKAVFNAPYGFVYGVAQRAGFAETAANRKAPAKAKVAKAAPVKATSKAKATPVVEVKRGRGRPKGSPNKPKVATATKPATASPAKTKAPAPVAKSTAAPVKAVVTPSVKKVALATKPGANGTQSAVSRVAARLADRKSAHA